MAFQSKDGRAPSQAGQPKTSKIRQAPTQPRLVQTPPCLQVTGEFFKLVPHGTGFIVVRVPRDQVRGAPRDILTRGQLEKLLCQQSIPTVPASTLSGYLGSLYTLPGFDRHAPGAFSRNLGTSNLAQSQWRGTLGEVSAQYGGAIPQRNLNSAHPNHAIFDLRDPWGGLNSVKTSVRTASPKGELFETYLRGLNDALGLRPRTFATAGALIYPWLPAAQGEALMLRKGYLSVNQDHVKPFQEQLRNPENYRKLSYRRLADQLLAHEPVQIGAKAYTTYQSLEGVHQGTATPAAARQQAAGALRSLREKLASRIQGNGLVSQHLTALQRFRQEIHAANPHLTAKQVESWVFPELILVNRYGGGMRGHLHAAKITGASGGATGAVVSILFEGGHLLWENQTDALLSPMLRAGAAGGASGVAGGATGSFVAARVGSPLARNFATQGMGSRVATGLGRIPGGAAAGGIAAPVFSMTSLALDGQKHTGTDYAAVGTRAFISGSLSAALAAGVTGAIFGSEVPLLGNAVGFIVGFAGYYAVDALFGDKVEHGVRGALEGGH